MEVWACFSELGKNGGRDKILPLGENGWRTQWDLCKKPRVEEQVESKGRRFDFRQVLRGSELCKQSGRVGKKRARGRMKGGEVVF